MINALYILIFTSISCSLLGVFLILRKLSMLIDAISHSVLLGIVIAFFFVGDLSSPILIIGASIMGIITVFLIELVGNLKLAQYDDAIGIIYPLLFSIAVILISKYLRNVHLNIDVVLLGEILFQSMASISILGFEVSKSLIISLSMCMVVLLFILVLYNKLKISTFDIEYAKLIGIPVGVLFYALMALSSLTAVISFNSVGAILVVSFFIAPGSSALLISKSLSQTLIFTALFSILNCTIGYFAAIKFNVSISGMCAFVNMLTYFVVLIIMKYIDIISIRRTYYGKKSYQSPKRRISGYDI